MKVRVTRTGRSGAMAGTVAAAALLMSGCGGQSPDIAATVNGTVITEKDVAAVSRDMSSLPVAGPTVDTQAILTTLILRPFVVEAAQRTGTMVSTSEARQALAEGVPNPSPQTLDFAQTSLITRRLPQQELAKVVQQFRAAAITVNPKYGTVDPQKGIIPSTQNWMAGGTSAEPQQTGPEQARPEQTGPEQPGPEQTEPQKTPATPKG